MTGFWKASVDEAQSKVTVIAPEGAVAGQTGQVVVFATTPAGLSVYRILEMIVE